MNTSPIRRMFTSVGGWLAGSLAEGRDAHQHRAARTRHPDAIVLDGRVEVAAAAVLLEEGVEVCE
jgi:hypothetical protein